MATIACRPRFIAQNSSIQRKISGCYRTEDGVTNDLTVRSYVSTARKQGVNVLVVPSFSTRSWHTQLHRGNGQGWTTGVKEFARDNNPVELHPLINEHLTNIAELVNSTNLEIREEHHRVTGR